MNDNLDLSHAVVIERDFDAPVDLVWRMWTEPEHFKAWYGPGGCQIPIAEMDVRVGGARRLCMQMPTPDGPMRMWFAGEYREVVECERLVYTEYVSDENGTMPPPGIDAAADHPAVTEVRVELENIDGRTRMVMTHLGIPAGSPGATGWEMALDKLAAHIDTRLDR
jgi:uncharacterized protein YndB with AHSA1/START domain